MRTSCKGSTRRRHAFYFRCFHRQIVCAPQHQAHCHARLSAIYTQNKRGKNTLRNSTALSANTRPISSSSLVRVIGYRRRTSLGGRGVVLVASLDVGVEPVQLLLVLADHRADDVADGDHPQHPRAFDHRDVSDAVLCKKRSAQQVMISSSALKLNGYSSTASQKSTFWLPVISCIACRTLVPGFTVISLFCQHDGSSVKLCLNILLILMIAK